MTGESVCLPTKTGKPGIKIWIAKLDSGLFFCRRHDSRGVWVLNPACCDHGWLYCRAWSRTAEVFGLFVMPGAGIRLGILPSLGLLISFILIVDCHLNRPCNPGG